MTFESIVFVHKERLPWRQIEENVIIVDLKREKVLDLDEVAKDVWNLIDGSRSAGEIVTEITENYDVARETALQDVSFFLQELRDKNLIYEKKD